MGNRRGQFNVSHSLAANAGEGNFHTALFADDAAVFHSLVFAAQTFVIFDRSENAGTEQAVSFRFESTIVDGLGLFDFAVRPGTDLLRRGNGDFDFVKRISVGRLLTKKFHNFIHIFYLQF